MCEFITIFETRGAFLVKIYLILEKCQKTQLLSLSLKDFLPFPSQKETKDIFQILLRKPLGIWEIAIEYISIPYRSSFTKSNLPQYPQPFVTP